MNVKDAQDLMWQDRDGYVETIVRLIEERDEMIMALATLTDACGQYAENSEALSNAYFNARITMFKFKSS